MRNRLMKATTLSFALAASGCAIGPDYQTPTSPLPAAFELAQSVPPRARQTEDGVVSDDTVLAHWWTTFEDPALDVLIERALAQNPDLSQAQARVAQARGILRLAKGDLAPSAALVAAGGYQQASLEDQTGGLFADGLAPRHSDFYQVGLDSSWELDVFGGRRRALEGAKADTDAAIERVLASRVIVAAETARAYYTVHALTQRIAVAERSIETARELVSLTSQRFDKGLSPRLDLTQAQALLANSEALLPQLEAARTEAESGLAVLTGGYLQDNKGLLQNSGHPLPTDKPIAAVMDAPVDIIRHRPDVRAAERRLAARNADIGVAVAEYFPKITLGGAVGYSALDTNNLVGSDAIQYSVGPRISWRLFDQVRIAGQVASARGRRAEQLAAYQASTVKAVAEVETAIAAYDGSRRTESKLRTSLEAAEETRDLSRLAYDGGVISFLQVIDAQRQLDVADDQLVIARLRTVESVISLYKSLGGGWSEADREQVVVQAAELVRKDRRRQG
ncbi:MAG: efflux transporter outer membrane subunit [Pseudomonadota bacterium]